MYTHDKRLQFEAKPEGPDPVLARRMQELIGGQYGEITVMMQYQFQGWNCRPGGGRGLRPVGRGRHWGA